MKKIFFTTFALLTTLVFFSCSNELENINNEDSKGKNNIVDSSDLTINKDIYLQQFSQILSKAVHSNQNIRNFLKEQALRKIDNGYNIFYPLAKNEQIGDRVFKDILADFEEKVGSLEEIERNVPLLNIHVPEIGNLKVANIDTSDDEIPVLFQDKLYYDGEIMDTLSSDEIPGFNLFVVCESSSICSKNRSTRSMNNCSLNETYEYVDPVFNPSYVNTFSSRASVEYEDLEEKYTEKGYVPSKDLDPLLIQAYNNSKGQKRATRYLMYYGLNSVNQDPTAMKPDIKDCIFRFKIAEDAFSRFEDIAKGDNKPLFNGPQSHKKSPLTRAQALNLLLTGRAFCFLFKIEGSISGTAVTSESMKVYAAPDKIFNLKINESKRHKTMFRHSKYTYTIDKTGIKSKWFYPLDHGQDTRLNRWDVSKDPIEKRIIVYLINPDEGFTKEVTETYNVTYISGGEIGGDISIPIKKITLGINGKLNNSNTTSKTITSKYTITQSNERIDEFQFNYFDDYPIENILDSKYIVPIRQGKGVIETSILPVSNHFYTQHRFEN